MYTQPASEVVIKSLLDLLAGVHHEGAVECDRRSNRQPAQQQDDDKLAILHGLAVGPGAAAAGQHVGPCGMCWVPRDRELSIRSHDGMG